MADITVDSTIYAALEVKAATLQSKVTELEGKLTTQGQEHATAISKHQTDLTKSEKVSGELKIANDAYGVQEGYRTRIGLVQSVMKAVEGASGQVLDPSFLRSYTEQINAITPEEWTQNEQMCSDKIAKTILEPAWKEQSDMFTRQFKNEAVPFVPYGADTNTVSQINPTNQIHTPNKTQVPSQPVGTPVSTQTLDPVKIMSDMDARFGANQDIRVIQK